MHEYAILDVFTDRPLQGNPVAVFTDAAALDTTTMQRAARELNLSETVFLTGGDGEADARARIFTPSAELPFAGHPVLGTAFLLGARTGRDLIRLRTGAGVIPIALTRDQGRLVYGEMAQPIPEPAAVSDTGALLGALGVDDAQRQVPVSAWRNGPVHTFVGLADAAAVDALAPDMGALAGAVPGGVSCYALIAPAVVYARVFVPALGVPEDPATGSAAGPLAVHLATQGVVPWGTEVEIHQGVSMGRPSLLRARALGGPDAIERVLVGGSAVAVAEGRYLLR